MKNFLIKFGLLGSLAILIFFVYFYTKSGKFRQSVVAAIVTVSVYLSSAQPTNAGQAHGFSPKPQQQEQQHNRSGRRSGFFSSKSSNDGSGPGKPNGNDNATCDIPKFPRVESVEEVKEHVSNINDHIKKLEETTDFDSDSESQKDKFEVDFDFELDKNGNPTLIIPMKDGNSRYIGFDQTRDKWYHKDIFPNISAPDGFDHEAVRKLTYKDKLIYLRENIPDKKVIELQNEIGKSLSHPKIISAPGFLGKDKREGTVDINMESGLVSFSDSVTNKHRTTVKMSRERIIKLAKEGFHLFPKK